MNPTLRIIVTLREIIFAELTFSFLGVKRAKKEFFNFYTYVTSQYMNDILVILLCFSSCHVLIEITMKYPHFEFSFSSTFLMIMMMTKIYFYMMRKKSCDVFENYHYKNVKKMSKRS